MGWGVAGLGVPRRSSHLCVCVCVCFAPAPRCARIERSCCGVAEFGGGVAELGVGGRGVTERVAELGSGGKFQGFAELELREPLEP